MFLMIQISPLPPSSEHVSYSSTFLFHFKRSMRLPWGHLDNLGGILIFRSITLNPPARSLLPCHITYLQVPGIRIL